MFAIRDKSVVRSSVIPSAKYCCSRLSLRLANGSTTIDRRGAGCASPNHGACQFKTATTAATRQRAPMTVATMPPRNRRSARGVGRGGVPSIWLRRPGPRNCSFSNTARSLPLPEGGVECDGAADTDLIQPEEATAGAIQAEALEEENVGRTEPVHALVFRQFWREPDNSQFSIHASRGRARRYRPPFGIFWTDLEF